MPPKQVETKQIDPEAEFSNVQRTFRRLAPMCSVEKRAAGIPQLAPQEKQLGILNHEMKETLLCIDLARKGLHAIRDASTKRDIQETIDDFEDMGSQLRDEKAQQAELDCLNYLTRKQLDDLRKSVPNEAAELAMMENSNLRLRKMENSLEIANKRFNIVNTDNMRFRQEIERLLSERNDFTIKWNRTIDKLVKGKEYLMDIFEIAATAFDIRDECCTKLEALKWKGMFQLNRDIMEMQNIECELNHLAKVEEFLRVKGSKRICEADEKEEIKRLEEITQCEEELAKYDELLLQIFTEAGSDEPNRLINRFSNDEVIDFSTFEYFCEILQASTVQRKDLEIVRQKILDQRDFNEAREEREDEILTKLRVEIEQTHEIFTEYTAKNLAADDTIAKVLAGIDDLVRVAKCETTPLLRLLGNHKQVTNWNATKFLKILECETKSLVHIAYGVVKPPAPTPHHQPVKGHKPPEGPAQKPVKTVSDPVLIKLRPNRIEKLIPYLPCVYCVEDFIMNLVFETPAVPADEEYIQSIFHLEDANTKFGIYTLTIPAKRHPYRGSKTD